jgi:hypothetical protein
MEKYLNKFIPIKHLIYIVQEYSRETYTFLSELIHTTTGLYHNFNSILYYENYVISYRKFIQKSNDDMYYIHYFKSDKNWGVRSSKFTLNKRSRRKINRKRR